MKMVLGAKTQMGIENERQLNVAQDFVNFIKEHNKRAKAKADDSTYDLLVRQASLITEMTKALAVKHTEIVDMRGQIEELKGKIDDLEREIRVSRDLLAISKAIKE